MAKKTKDKKILVNRLDDEVDDDGGEGEGGKGRGGKGVSIYLPSFDELVAISPEEAELARAAKDALFAQRVSLKSKGHKVEALDRKQELRNQLNSPGPAQAAGNTSNLEQHPELPELGGAFDDIVFPEDQIEEAAANDPQLRNELKARLGMGMSIEALKYELENKNKEKMRMTARPAPEQRYTYEAPPPRPLPKPRPF